MTSLLWGLKKSESEIQGFFAPLRMTCILAGGRQEVTGSHDDEFEVVLKGNYRDSGCARMTCSVVGIEKSQSLTTRET
jgi:hypothetical protein